MRKPWKPSVKMLRAPLAEFEALHVAWRNKRRAFSNRQSEESESEEIYFLQVGIEKDII